MRTTILKQFVFVSLVFIVNNACIAQSNKDLKEARKLVKEAEDYVISKDYKNASNSYLMAYMYSDHKNLEYKKNQLKYFAMIFGLEIDGKYNVDDNDLEEVNKIIAIDTGSADGYLIKAVVYLEYSIHKKKDLPLLLKYYDEIVTPAYNRATALKNYDRHLYDTVTYYNYEIASLLKRKQSEELTQKYKQIVAANLIAATTPKSVVVVELSKKELAKQQHYMELALADSVRANTYVEQKKYAEAAADFESAYNFSGKQWYNCLKQHYKCLVLSFSEKKYVLNWWDDDQKKDEKLIDKIITAEPNSGDGYLIKSALYLYYATNKYDNYSTSWNKEFYLGVNNYKKALEFTNYDRQLFDSVKTYFNYAAKPRIIRDYTDYIGTKDYTDELRPEAFRSAKALIGEFPDDVAGYDEYNKLLVSDRRCGEAIEYSKMIIKKFPNYKTTIIGDCYQYVKPDSAFYYYYLSFKNEVDNYKLNGKAWFNHLNKWQNLAVKEEGEEKVDDDNFVWNPLDARLDQIGYYLVQKNKYRSAIACFLKAQDIPLAWVGDYNAAVLLSNLKLPAFMKEAKELFEFAKRTAPNDSVTIRLFSKAEIYLKTNKPIPVAMIEQKIFDDYLLANKFETVDEYCRRNHTGKYKDNNSVPAGTNDLGISESDFNQVNQLIAAAGKASRSASERVDNYNRKTKDGTINTQTTESLLSEGFITSDVSEAISSLEKANDILRRARTSENSNKVNAAINHNEEDIKDMRSLVSKKKYID